MYTYIQISSILSHINTWTDSYAHGTCSSHVPSTYAHVHMCVCLRMCTHTYTHTHTLALTVQMRFTWYKALHKGTGEQNC